MREDFWPLNTALYARDFQGNIPRFVYYFLQGIDWEKFNDKSGVPGINRNDVHRESVFVPPLDQQKQIVSVLGALDDKIELNRRMNETLEAMAQAIFRDWFVDFGPVRRKMAGVSDPVAIMGGLTPDPSRAAELAALFPDQLGDDGLPEGWRPATVGSAFNLTMGQSPPGDTYNENGDGLPFFQGRTDFGFRFPEPRKFCTHPTRTARPDDTLISVRAPVGDLNMAWEECCIGRGVAAARHKAGGKTYTYYAMKALQPDLVQFDNEGTVFGAINKKQFEQLVVVEPGDKLTSAFEALAAPLDDRLRSGAAENRTLAETRDYLLPRLMSGEVRVRDLNLENIA
ncbi:type I restriction enzyme S subunit [Camelimonas lactis]|uniref:Type I restriction enzyme S subunit n=1 Tax=Camelimonas lactis TaxID=659006 RepID=A0A4R2GVZ6_9HYPH|nr:type I restriction enzyme S subunit [Camelimonas lactis]